MIRISETQISIRNSVHHPYFDDLNRLVYFDRPNTVAFDIQNQTCTKTGEMTSLCRFSNSSCVGLRGENVVRWDYLQDRTDALTVPNVSPASSLLYDDEQGLGILCNSLNYVRTHYVALDANFEFTELLETSDNEFLLDLVFTENGPLACIGFEEEFDTNRIRYLNRFHKPVMFEGRTRIFPKYKFRYEQRVLANSGRSLYSHRILTSDSDLVLKFNTLSFYPFLYKTLQDGERFVADYEDRLLLISASRAEVVTELPGRSWPMLQSVGGNYLLGSAYFDREEHESHSKDYWIFDLRRNEVVETIRLPDSFRHAVCNRDGTMILLYDNEAIDSRDRPKAILLDYQPRTDA